MARMEIVEGAIEFVLKGNDAQVVRVSAKGEINGSDVAELKSPQLVQIYNMTSGDPIKKFRDHATAVKRTTEALNTHLAEQETALAPAAGNGRKGRAPRHDEGMKIKVLAEENPKRKNSKSYDRFELYADGMTVTQALEAGLRREDLRWDEEHGFIEIHK